MPRPNILLITGDHARHDAVGCNLDLAQPHSLARMIRTPHLDLLAGTGVTFRHAFTPNPICVPGRASITTGRYSHKCTGSKSNGGRIADGQPKLAEHFAHHGYATAAIGKLHYVPYAPPGTPRLAHGFQTIELNEEGRVLSQFDPLGLQTGLEDYHDYLKGVRWGGYERSHGVGNNDVHPSPSPLPAEFHEGAWVANRTIGWLERHLAESPGQPFLIWSSFTKPHPPYDPPRPYDSIYDPRQCPTPLGDWEDETLLEGRDMELRSRRKLYGWERLSRESVQVIRSYYCGQMTFQDAMIGRILGFLAEAGLAGNTVVIYTTDHGDLLGDFGRFFKSCMMDGSVRIPMIWSVPGLIPESGPHVRDHLVGLQDVLPTLASLTETPLSAPVDGVDLTGILREETAPGRDFIVSQTGEPPVQKYMVRTPQWKYVYTAVEALEELYDVRRADSERVNLAGDSDFAGIQRDLRRVLVEWCRENGDWKMLDGDGLAAVSKEVLPAPEFSAGRMGWRKY